MRNQGKYDPAEFNVPPELEKGKSQRIQCYIQSGHERALSIIARSGVFPFEKDADVIRFCIKCGLDKLNTLEPDLINSVMRRTNIMIEFIREEVNRQKFLEWMTSLRGAVQGHVGRNEEDMARELVLRCQKQINAMPDDPEWELRWKLKYLQQLETDFRPYLTYEKAAA